LAPHFPTIAGAQSLASARIQYDEILCLSPISKAAIKFKAWSRYRSAITCGVIIRMPIGSSADDYQCLIIRFLVISWGVERKTAGGAIWAAERCDQGLEPNRHSKGGCSSRATEGESRPVDVLDNYAKPIRGHRRRFSRHAYSIIKTSRVFSQARKGCEWGILGYEEPIPF